MYNFLNQYRTIANAYPEHVLWISEKSSFELKRSRKFFQTLIQPQKFSEKLKCTKMPDRQVTHKYQTVKRPLIHPAFRELSSYVSAEHERISIAWSVEIGFQFSVNESGSFSVFSRNSVPPDNLIASGYRELIKLYASVRLSGVI